MGTLSVEPHQFLTIPKRAHNLQPFLAQPTHHRRKSLYILRLNQILSPLSTDPQLLEGSVYVIITSLHSIFSNPSPPTQTYPAERKDGLVGAERKMALWGPPLQPSGSQRVTSSGFHLLVSDEGAGASAQFMNSFCNSTEAFVGHGPLHNQDSYSSSYQQLMNQLSNATFPFSNGQPHSRPLSAHNQHPHASQVLWNLSQRCFKTTCNPSILLQSASVCDLSFTAQQHLGGAEPEAHESQAVHSSSV